MPKIEELKSLAKALRIPREVTAITLAAIEDAGRYKKDENGLLPCFKCGDKGDVFARENSFTHEDGYQALCVNSGCDAQGSWSKDWNMAVVFWNEERQIPAAVRAVLDVTGGGE